MSTDVSGMIGCRPGARLWGPEGEDSVWEVGIDLFLLNRGNAYEKDSPRAGEADLIVAKHRYGPTATLTVAHQGHYGRFVDLANP